MIYLFFGVPASFLVLFPKKTLVWKSGTNTAADSFLDGALHLLRKLRLQLSTESGYDFLQIGAHSYSGPLCLSWFDDVEMWFFVRCQDISRICRWIPLRSQSGMVVQVAAGFLGLVDAG